MDRILDFSCAEELLSDYGLSFNKLYKTVTDSGSNILSAFKDVLYVDVNLASLKEYDEQDSEDGEEGSEYELDDLDGEHNEEDEEETVDSIIQAAFPVRILCFAHCLQLNMRTLIGKFQHSFSMTSELSAATGQSLISPSTTRWASFIMVIRRFLELHEAIAEIAKRKEWNVLSKTEIEFLKNMHKLSKMLVGVLIRIQGKNSWRFVVAMAIKCPLEKAKMVDVCDLNYDPVYVMAAAFDPNTVPLLNKENFDLAVNAILSFVNVEALEQLQADFPSTEETELDVFLNKITQEESKKRQ